MQSVDFLRQTKRRRKQCKLSCHLPRNKSSRCQRALHRKMSDGLVLHCHEFTLVFGIMSHWRVYEGLLSPCAPALRTFITMCTCSFSIFWVSTPHQRLWQVLEVYRPIRGSPNPHRMYRSGRNRNLKFDNIKKKGYTATMYWGLTIISQTLGQELHARFFIQSSETPLEGSIID